jgi:hypothetical protein
MTGDQSRFLNIGDRVCFNCEQADRGTVNDRRASDEFHGMQSCCMKPLRTGHNISVGVDL